MMRELQVASLVLVCLSALVLRTGAQTTVVISPDGTVEAILNDITNTTFKCVVKEAGILTWIVDRMSAQHERIHNRGIIMSEVNTLDSGDLQGNITIPNRAVNNQTTLICVAKNVHPPEVYSSEVILQLLAQVSVIANSTTTTSNSALETAATVSLSSAASSSSTVVIFMINLCVSIIILLVL